MGAISTKESGSVVQDRKRGRRDAPAADPYHGQLAHNGASEASILGGVILRNDALALIDTLEVDDFYDNRHKVVFAAIRNLEARGMPIDIVTLENEIEKTGKLDAIGGVAFLGELVLRMPTVDNVEAYAKIVRQHRITRDVRMMIGEVMLEAEQDGIEGEQLVHDVTVALLSVATGDERPIYEVGALMADEAAKLRADMDAKAAGKEVFSGVPTGIAILDLKTGGNPIGEPAIYIARPGCGKTTMAMHLARSSKRIAGIDSLLATNEDGKTSFGLRAIGQESHVSTELLRARRVKSEELEAVEAAVAAMRASRTESLLEAGGMTVDAMVRRVRRENLVRRHRGQKKYGQLILDYLQKVPQPPHAGSRDEGLAYVCAVLSDFAQEEQMAVAIFAQLNREVERRDDKRPRISDIRDTGAGDATGKLIIGLHRPWTYEPLKKDATGRLVNLESDLHVLVIKNNNGEGQFDIRMFWDVKSHALYDTEIDYAAALNQRRAGPRGQQSMGEDFARRFDDTGDWHVR